MDENDIDALVKERLDAGSAFVYIAFDGERSFMAQILGFNEDGSRNTIILGRCPLVPEYN